MADTNVTSYPRIHTTGAVHNFVEVPVSTSTSDVRRSYLGTCEITPQISLKKARLPVKNDLGGRMIPFQEIEQGEIGEISMLLNRFSNTAYGEILALPNAGVATATEGAGSETRYHRGQLTYGLHTFALVQVFDFYGQSFPGADKLIQGYYWYNCEVADHQTTGGTGDEKLMIAIKANPVWQTSSLGFLTYSNTHANIATCKALIDTMAIS